MITDTRAKRQADIISAAAKEFEKNGFECTKMGEIARRAGIGKSTIYEYFPSKLDLLSIVLEEEFRSVNEDIARYFEEPITFREKIVAILGRTGDFFIGTLHALINMPGSESTVRFMHQYGEKERDFILALIEKNVQHAIHHGEIRPDIDPKFASMLLLLLFITAGNHTLLENFDAKLQVQAVDFLFDGIAPPAKGCNL